MPEFRKKPVIVSANRITRDTMIKTDDGIHLGKQGDWMVFDNGSQYFYKDEDFQKEFDPLEVHKEIAKAPDLVKLTPREARKNSPKQVENLKIPNWTDEEKDVIRSAPEKHAAVTVFREKFPGSPRSDGAISQRWTLLKNAAGTSLAPYADEGPELSEKKKVEEDRIDKPGPDIKKKKAPREDSAQSDEKPLQGTKDAMGSLISVGSKVLLIGNNIGVGEVKAVSQDGIVHAKFPYNTKVLPGSRFEVVK